MFSNQKLKHFKISGEKCNFRQTVQLQIEPFQNLIAFFKHSKFLADLV